MTGAVHERGIALITALILVAIATVLAAMIGYNAELTARRAALDFDSEQALLVAEGAEAMAAYALKQNADPKLPDTPDQAWAQPYGPLPVAPGVSIQFAQIKDQQSKFNLNNLDPGGKPDPIALHQFQQLLGVLKLEPSWAQKVADWIDADQQANDPGGFGDSVYLSQNPPYRSAAAPITSVSELMSLVGFGRARYDRLSPYVAALPPGTAVNICTAPGPVLDAISGNVEYSRDPAQLAKARTHRGCFPGLATFEASLSAQQRTRLGNRLTSHSSYFRLQTVVSIGSVRFTLYSLLYRDGARIFPIIRTFGTE